MKSNFQCSVLFIVCSISLFFSSLDAQNSKRSWSNKFGYQKSFIENKGQFSIPNSFGNSSPVLFAVDHGGTKIYFTKKGITYTFLETSKKQKDAKEIERERKEEFKNPEGHARREKEEHQLKTKADQVTMLWQNANINTEIIADEVTDDYHNYYFKQSTGEYKNVSNVKGFKKITYKNIYPNIDIDYVFSEKGGLEYSLTLHSGANPSQVKMLYDRNIELNNRGDIYIDTKFEDIIDHAPLTFYDNNHSSIITSNFIKTGKTVSFQLGNYDNTKTVVIDPWTEMPTFTSNWDCVWECEKDAIGNVYVIGGVTPMQLLKYNSAGALQWTYNTPYDTTAWLGTVATDLAGNSYVTNGSIAKILKVDNTGFTVWTNNTSGSMDEYWSIAFNCDQTQLIVGGTTGSSSLPFSILGAIFDIDVNTGVPTHTQVVAYGSTSSFPPSIQEVRSITAGKNNKYYFLTLDSIGSIGQNVGSCGANVNLYKTTSTHAFAYKCENFRYDNSGIAAIKADDNFLYTHNGTTLFKRSLTNASITASVTIPGGIATTGMGQQIVGCSGIDVDASGNIYVGSSNAVTKFNSSLMQVATETVSFNVYDVHVTNGGGVIACGSTGNSSTATRSGYVQCISSLAAGSIVSFACCDVNICKLSSQCVSTAAFNLSSSSAGGVWTGNGITNTVTGTFNPSIAGVGNHSIKYTLPCGSDSVNIIVNACGPVTVCTINGSLTASPSAGSYTWASTSASISCTACSGGNCIPFVCPGVSVPTWSATGVTVAVPNSSVFPIVLRDLVSGNTYTFSTLAALPTCSVTGIVQQNQLSNTISVYPNPNNGEFSVSYSFVQEGQIMILFDMLGKEVKQFDLENTNGVKNINISDLSNGTYIYKIQNKGEALFTGKINLNK